MVQPPLPDRLRVQPAVENSPSSSCVLTIQSGHRSLRLDAIPFSARNERTSYLATDGRQSFVIKVWRMEGGAAALLEGVERLRRGLEGLEPSVVPIMEAGFADPGRAFYKRRFVSGVSLLNYCHQPSLTPNRAELLARVLSALVACHRRGIVHGDLKPANVIVQQDGQVTVADFVVPPPPRTSPNTAPDSAFQEDLNRFESLAVACWPAESRLTGDRPFASLLSHGILEGSSEYVTSEAVSASLRELGGALPATQPLRKTQDQPVIKAPPEQAPPVSHMRPQQHSSRRTLVVAVASLIVFGAIATSASLWFRETSRAEALTDSRVLVKGQVPMDVELILYGRQHSEYEFTNIGAGTLLLNGLPFFPVAATPDVSTVKSTQQEDVSAAEGSLGVHDELFDGLEAADGETQEDWKARVLATLKESPQVESAVERGNGILITYADEGGDELLLLAEEGLPARDAIQREFHEKLVREFCDDLEKGRSVYIGNSVMVTVPPGDFGERVFARKLTGAPENVGEAKEPVAAIAASAATHGD